MAMAAGSGYGGSPRKTTKPVSLSALDRAIVEQGRALDPYTQWYHTPQQQASAPAAPVIQPFKSSLPAYQVKDVAPIQNVWNPLGSKGFSFDAPQIKAPSYDARVADPYMISEQSGLEGEADYGFREWLDIISQQLRAGEDRRLLAAAETQAARGMLRSGQAILSEDAVRRDTELQIAQKAAEAAVEQARLTQERDIAAAELRFQREQSNQRAMEAWAELAEQAQQYRANLDLQARLANQQAALTASGQARDYAAKMAELDTQRRIANQQAQIDLERIRAGYDQFMRELEFSSWAKTQELAIDRYSAQANAAYNSGILELQRRQAAGTPSIDWNQVLKPFMEMGTTLDDKYLDLDATMAYLASAYGSVPQPVRDLLASYGYK